MSGAKARLAQVSSHFLPLAQLNPAHPTHRVSYHTLSPTHFLPRAAAIEPEAEAIVHTTANGRTLRRSYGEFADRARGLAYYLRKHGLQRVGILCPNTPAFLEAIFGIAAAGAVNVAVNYRLKSEDIEYILAHAEVEALIVDAAFVASVMGFCKRHPDVVLLVDLDVDGVGKELSGPYDQAVHEGLHHDVDTGGAGWDGLETQARDEDGLIALAYTSGTTARPKGVEYTHRGAYMAALANIIESGLNVDGGRCRYLWTLPMFHAMGWTFPWAVTAVRGTHYCLRKIVYSEMWRLLREEAMTHYCAAPTVNTLLCDDKAATALPKPVRVTVAASPPTPALFQQMLSLNLQPVHVYGLTETYGPITKCYYMPAWDALPPDERYRRMARQGFGFITSLPVRVVKTNGPEHAIVDVVKNGEEIGEIVFAGNICAAGYYKDDEATRKLFAGGVMHSGDLAVWHADGAVQIIDRAKDIIISGGENISSVALESMLAAHPDILEAGVVAVEDARYGERPKAFITVKRGRTVKPEDVIEWARHHSSISKFMVPREVEIVNALPKTSTGKIKKNELREWAKGIQKA